MNVLFISTVFILYILWLLCTPWTVCNSQSLNEFFCADLFMLATLTWWNEHFDSRHKLSLKLLSFTREHKPVQYKVFVKLIVLTSYVNTKNKQLWKYRKILKTGNFSKYQRHCEMWEQFNSQSFICWCPQKNFSFRDQTELTSMMWLKDTLNLNKLYFSVTLTCRDSKFNPSSKYSPDVIHTQFDLAAKTAANWARAPSLPYIVFNYLYHYRYVFIHPGEVKCFILSVKLQI